MLVLQLFGLAGFALILIIGFRGLRHGEVIGRRWVIIFYLILGTVLFVGYGMSLILSR